MSKLKLLSVSSALAATVWMVACGSDDPEPNPSFTVGDAGAPAAGQPGFENGGEPGQPNQAGTAGNPSGGTTAPTGGTANAGSPPEIVAGAGGAQPEQPPYDCVLHPTTHLEIINACTDALRIEKHPTLPALP